MIRIKNQKKYGILTPEKKYKSTSPSSKKGTQIHHHNLIERKTITQNGQEYTQNRPQSNFMKTDVRTHPKRPKTSYKDALLKRTKLAAKYSQKSKKTNLANSGKNRIRLANNKLTGTSKASQHREKLVKSTKRQTTSKLVDSKFHAFKNEKKRLRSSSNENKDYYSRIGGIRFSEQKRTLGSSASGLLASATGTTATQKIRSSNKLLSRLHKKRKRNSGGSELLMQKGTGGGSIANSGYSNYDRGIKSSRNFVPSSKSTSLLFKPTAGPKIARRKSNSKKVEYVGKKLVTTVASGPGGEDVDGNGNTVILVIQTNDQKEMEETLNELKSMRSAKKITKLSHSRSFDSMNFGAWSKRSSKILGGKTRKVAHQQGKTGQEYTRNKSSKRWRPPYTQMAQSKMLRKKGSQQLTQKISDMLKVGVSGGVINEEQYREDVPSREGYGSSVEYAGRVVKRQRLDQSRQKSGSTISGGSQGKPFRTAESKGFIAQSNSYLYKTTNYRRLDKGGVSGSSAINIQQNGLQQSQNQHIQYGVGASGRGFGGTRDLRYRSDGMRKGKGQQQISIVSKTVKFRDELRNQHGKTWSKNLQPSLSHKRRIKHMVENYRDRTNSSRKKDTTTTSGRILNIQRVSKAKRARKGEPGLDSYLRRTLKSLKSVSRPETVGNSEEEEVEAAKSKPQRNYEATAAGRVRNLAYKPKNTKPTYGDYLDFQSVRENKLKGIYRTRIASSKAKGGDKMRNLKKLEKILTKHSRKRKISGSVVSKDSKKVNIDRTKTTQEPKKSTVTQKSKTNTLNTKSKSSRAGEENMLTKPEGHQQENLEPVNILADADSLIKKISYEPISLRVSHCGDKDQTPGKNAVSVAQNLQNQGNQLNAKSENFNKNQPEILLEGELLEEEDLNDNMGSSSLQLKGSRVEIVANYTKNQETPGKGFQNKRNSQRVANRKNSGNEGPQNSKEPSFGKTGTKPAQDSNKSSQAQIRLKETLKEIKKNNRTHHHHLGYKRGPQDQDRSRSLAAKSQGGYKQRTASGLPDEKKARRVTMDGVVVGNFDGYGASGSSEGWLDQEDEEPAPKPQIQNSHNKERSNSEGRATGRSGKLEGVLSRRSYQKRNLESNSHQDMHRSKTESKIEVIYSTNSPGMDQALLTTQSDQVGTPTNPLQFASIRIESHDPPATHKPKSATKETPDSRKMRINRSNNSSNQNYDSNENTPSPIPMVNREEIDCLTDHFYHSKKHSKVEKSEKNQENEKSEKTQINRFQATEEVKARPGSSSARNHTKNAFKNAQIENPSSGKSPLLLEDGFKIGVGGVDLDNPGDDTGHETDPERTKTPIQVHHHHKNNYYDASMDTSKNTRKTEPKAAMHLNQSNKTSPNPQTPQENPYSHPRLPNTGQNSIGTPDHEIEIPGFKTQYFTKKFEGGTSESPRTTQSHLNVDKVKLMCQIKSQKIKDQEKVRHEQEEEQRRNIIESTCNFNPIEQTRLYYLDSLKEALEGKDQENQFYSHYLHNIQSMQYISTLQPLEEDDFIEKKVYLPPKRDPCMKTLILDLDETLVHCDEDLTLPADLKIPIKFTGGEIVHCGVTIRPHAKQFLQNMSLFFEIVIFTASHACYANRILSLLDPQNKYITFRMFRESCIETEEGIFIKDLRVFANRSLDELIIVDNAFFSFGFQMSNGVPIVPFLRDKRDKELEILSEFLLSIKDHENHCETLRTYFMSEIFERFMNDGEKLEIAVLKGIEEMMSA